MQNDHEKHMSLATSYVEACANAKYEASKDLLEALKTAESSGELNLPSMNLNVWTWQLLSKLISASTIRSLNISNCLIPPRGLATICSVLSQGSNIIDLDLRGNNIQAEGVSYIGKMMRYNISLKRISLEWNCIGSFMDTYTIFCDGLAANQSIEMLDLRNNQLNAECAPALANALTKNCTLKSIDLRWNNLGWKGGHALHTVFQTNQSLIKMKLQGNCIPVELTVAIEQCASHNASRAALMAECAERTRLLAERLRAAEEERQREMLTLSQRSDHTVQQIVQTAENRVAELERRLQSREAEEQALRQRLEGAEEELQEARRALEEGEAAMRRATSKQRAHVVELTKQLTAKSEELAALEADLRAQLCAEAQRRRAAEAEAAAAASCAAAAGDASDAAARRHAEELRRAVEETGASAERRADERLRAQAQTHEAAMAAQCEKAQQHIAGLQGEAAAWQARAEALGRALEEQGRREAELLASLAAERQARENIAATEASRASLLDERISAAAEERRALEAKLQAQISQLKAQRDGLSADAAEAQRKLSKLQEELAAEQSTAARLRGELQAQRASSDALRAEVESLHAQVAEMLREHADAQRERQAERGRLEQLMKQRDAEIDSIRAQEVERANNLYTAFSKYLSSVSPTASGSKTPPRPHT